MTGTYDILRQELSELRSDLLPHGGWREDVQAIRIAARLLEHAAYEQAGSCGPEEAARLIAMAADLERIVQSRMAVHH